MTDLFDLPRRIHVRDMTLRDGLQSLPRVVPLADKLAIYALLAEAGVSDFQVTSFVTPDRVPQLADAEDLWSELAGRDRRHNVLVANRRGFDRAVAAGALDMEVVISASAAYNRINVRRTPEESLRELDAMAADAGTSGARVSAVVANAFHCRHEGRIGEDTVMAMVGRMAAAGIAEISLADTTGHAAPDHLGALFAAVRAAYPDLRLGAHLHDTKGRGLVNALAAVAAGADWLDASLAGLGGSPFTPGVGGNLSLEMLVDTLTDMGIDTGIRTDGAIEAGRGTAALLSQPDGEAVPGVGT
ncbi:MAG: hydroxymethylglutaryl-CoA lyase [Bauldia litoralis]